MASLSEHAIECPACHERLPMPITSDKGHREGDRWVLGLSLDPAVTESITSHFKAHTDALSN